ncbi:STAS domain-containing protein [Streptomyces sp. NBC_00344]|uniref:STAS domain-containing protein n=1 Tax=Streptomyces sp. NBC_00344 TaxID=2975720 RepID=UPI002E210147
MPWDEAIITGPVGDTAANSACPPDSGAGSGGAAAQAGATQYALPGAWVVVAAGEYDIDTITPLSAALSAAAAEHPRVILDASGVTFADSSFLNMLILVHQKTDLRVAAPGTQLRRLLDLTGMNAVLQIRATVEEAAIS